MVGTGDPRLRVRTANGATALLCGCGWSTGPEPSSVLAFRSWQEHIDLEHQGQRTDVDRTVQAFAHARDEMVMHERLVEVASAAQAGAIRSLRSLGMSTAMISDVLGLAAGTLLDLEARYPAGLRPPGRRDD